MYYIKITYDTGDSFNTETGLVETLPLSWNNQEKAEQALNDIHEHYKAYYAANKEWGTTIESRKEIEDKARTKSWFRHEDNGQYWEFGIMLENDEGERVLCGTSFYCGYFEYLQGAEIVLDNKWTFKFDPYGTPS